MQLREISKHRYRTRLKYITWCAIALLLFGALSISTLLILLFGNPTGSHFHFNVTGVVLTLSGMGLATYLLRHHDYLAEMYYVWRVKFELSHINRKINAIEKSANAHNKIALDILAYYYQGTRQVWLLDDNTLTLSELSSKENQHKALAEAAQYLPDITSYQRQLLEQF